MDQSSPQHFDLDYYLRRSPDRTPPLFKFRSARDARHTGALAQGRLWISNMLELNDPFDSKPQEFLLARDEDERRRFIERIRNIGVISFTSELSNDSRDLLLWSHYADGHRGFCLVIQDKALYDKSRLVTYDPRYPELAGVSIDSPDFLEKVGNFKALEWSYENERRVLFEGNVDTYYDLPPQAIFAVLFGCWGVAERRNARKEERTRPEIASEVLKHSPQCRFFEAKIVPRAFRVRYNGKRRFGCLVDTVVPR